MTGYGSGSYTDRDIRLDVEAKSLNHKYRDICVHLPKPLARLEHDIRRKLQQQFLRGRFDVWVKIETVDFPSRKLKLDLSLVNQYLVCLQELQQNLGIKGEIDIKLIARNPSLFTLEENETDMGDLSVPISAALEQALESLANMRTEEGRALDAEIRRLSTSLSQILTKIEQRFPEFIKDYQARLISSVKRLANDIEIEPLRVAQEVALYADRSDIGEELVRLQSHLEQLGCFLDEEGAVGKKLDFLIQEINRELNTIGSKASDTFILHLVVEAKDILEKIRELVQNVE